MFSNKTILIVDDDDRNVMALTAVLKFAGPVIIVAKDGLDCLEKLKIHTNVDIVLLDMMMPEMDGYETLKNIRNNALTKALPVIALTSNAMKGDKQKCIDAGADEYCSKPIDVDLLLSQMKKLLGL